MRQRANFHGFTLVEIMITVATIAVLALLAAPSMRDYQRSVMLSRFAAGVGEGLARARSEAVKANMPVLLCAKNATETGCSAVLNWSNGWLVCYDVNDDGVCGVSTPTLSNPIAVSAPVPSGLTMTGPSAPMRFDGQGTVISATTVLVKGTWSGTDTYTVYVAVSGDVHVIKG